MTALAQPQVPSRSRLPLPLLGGTITCGHCGGKHPTANDVRLCSLWTPESVRAA